jgi:release factor glutamine methyltransferase
MSAPLPPLTEAAIVSRLRAAGCVFAEDEARLLLAAAKSHAALTEMVDRRVAGLPLEHILGWVEFFGLRIDVDPGVFVPRRRSEFLVHEAASRAEPGAVVLDLCCGSGALGVALASVVPGIELHATDIEAPAVLCARRNVGALGGHVYEGDLFAPLPTSLRGRVDILLANTPYVPTDAIGLMPPEARFHEPHVTLDGGADGLDVQRRVAAAAREWLAPGGYLLVETGETQAATTAAIFRRHGLSARIATSEELYATVVIGKYSASAGKRSL